jgi:PKD repeat protein
MKSLFRPALKGKDSVLETRNALRAACVLLLASAAGCDNTGIKNVDRKPVADFKLVQSTVRPQVVTLDAAQSFATVGTLTKFLWTFGDEATGSPRTEATTPTFQHAYASAGDFTITLVVTDDKGTESEPVTRTVNVPSINTEAPRANISGPSTGNPGSSLSFDGSASTPTSDLKNYAWSFGDGSTEQGADKKQVSHTFANAGNYKVTLTVTDSLNQNDTTELNVVVGAVGPVAVCNWTPNPALQGVPVNFSGSGSTSPPGSTISLYVWTWGDGSADGTGVTATHTYNVQATFQPRLKVLDNLNRLHEVNCPQVVVGAPPLCTGTYSLAANPTSQLCGALGTATWGGNQWTMTMNANGTITAQEMFAGMPINFSGTWAGQTFTMTGAYDVPDSLGTSHSDVTINGTWTGGCGGWTGTWREVNSHSLIGPTCTLTWNVTSSKL